ncbi:MAG TPA: Rab family GTPase [Methanomassiliicoccales archaeon]|nr:Rab family GTPase [Methanomassiliicoccales archaeon]
MERKRYIRKVCLLGDGGVGKTSLVRRYVDDVFNDKYIVSFGTKVSKKVLNVGEVELTLMIWDVLGQRSEDSLHAAYYRGSNGAMLVGDLSRQETMEHLRKWRDDLLAVEKDAKTLIVGNKADLETGTGSSWLASLSKQLGSEVHRTSAKTGEGVENAFAELGKMLLGSG